MTAVCSLALCGTFYSTPAQAEPALELLPPDAKAGHCYARVFVPPQYRTETETLLKHAEYERLEVSQQRFEPVNETIVVREASERLEVVPATYEMVTERVLMKPASKRLVTVPAEFENVSEQVLVKAAHTVWKKGRGPLQRLDNSTGEIMCLVEVPAEYKTVTRRVVKTPATTREVEVPAEYKTVTRRVMKTPPTTRKVVIPAEYASVTVMKPTTKAEIRRVTVPAVNQTVARTMKTTEGEMAWREILCETNMNAGLIRDVQRKLASSNHYNGPIDGIIGRQTVEAVQAFQREQGLPSGHLTIDSLNKLGVTIASND